MRGITRHSTNAIISLTEKHLLLIDAVLTFGVEGLNYRARKRLAKERRAQTNPR